MISIENKHRLFEFVKNMSSAEIQIAKFNYDLAHKLNVQAQTEIDRINQRVGIFVQKQDVKLNFLEQAIRIGIEHNSCVYHLIRFGEVIRNINKIE